MDMDDPANLIVTDLGLGWSNAPGWITDRPEGVGGWQINLFHQPVRLRSDGREITTRGPTVVVFPPGLAQWYVAATPDGFSDDWISVTGAVAPLLAAHGLAAGQPIAVRNAPAIERWMQHLEEEFRVQAPYATEALAEGLRHLIRLVARGRSGGVSGGEAILAVRERLRRRCGEPWTIAQMARSAGMAPGRFARQYRWICGTSPVRDLTWFRLRRARELLDDGRRGIADVARRCGFADQLYFSRVFRRWMGVPPTVWRQVRRGLRT